MDVAALIQGVLAGDRRAAARAISMVEDGDDDLPSISEAVFPKAGRAYTVGLTGSPGVGKSTLAAGLVADARGRDETVAVLAIDPTSPFSGGALLGDRVRMQSHATDPGVFIRSMATRGHLGGMSLAAPEAVRILDAAGHDLVIVETVGVGQAEVEVAGATDTTLVVVAPGWGDAVQVAKAGILEVADVFVVNKADREGVDEAVRDLNLMIRMGPHRAWTPPVVRASASSGDGVADVRAAIERHREYLQSSGELDEGRRRRALEEVQNLIGAELRRSASSLLADRAGAKVADELAARRLDPYRAAAALLELIRSGSGTFAVHPDAAEDA
ncbi:MAG TPA: methylmalonyl Co-A mutase-associated GTPase MeaB [Actinomycetota bacterium]